MKVSIKKFGLDLDVKSKGMELDIKSPDGKKRLGDCCVTMTGLVWCKGKTTKANGIKLSWDELATILASNAAKKAALKAAKAA